MNRLWDVLRRRRVLVAILVLSLAVNAFFLAKEVTDAVRHSGPRFGPPRALTAELRWMARRMPEEASERIQAALAPLRPDVEARLTRMRDLRREVERLAAAPQPDRAAIDERLEAIHREASTLQQMVEKTTYDALLELPPEMRAGLSEPPVRRR
jgi:hypothetical protein